MGCDYHKNVTYALEITVTTTKKYKIPLVRTPKKRMHVTVIWFDKIEGDSKNEVHIKGEKDGDPGYTIPAGTHFILYDFQEVNRPETRTQTPAGFDYTKSKKNKGKNLALSYFTFGDDDAKNPKGCMKIFEVLFE